MGHSWQNETDCCRVLDRWKRFTVIPGPCVTATCYSYHIHSSFVRFFSFTLKKVFIALQERVPAMAFFLTAHFFHYSYFLVQRIESFTLISAFQRFIQMLYIQIMGSHMRVDRKYHWFCVSLVMSVCQVFTLPWALCFPRKYRAVMFLLSGPTQFVKFILLVNLLESCLLVLHFMLHAAKYSYFPFWGWR